MQAKPQSISSSAAIESWRREPRPLLLECGVQHYAWGDRNFIPALLGLANPERKPFAELWIGDHPDLPASALVGGEAIPLDRLCSALPELIFGSRSYKRLPFLLKILAAAQPLSIQVHPDRAQAEVGFTRENQLGIPLDAPTRNYKDPNPKPELLCALTDFYALQGFLPEPAIAQVLSGTPELAPLLPEFARLGLARFYRYWMELAQEEVERYLAPLIARLKTRAPFAKDELEYWVLKAAELYSYDRGLLSFYLLNFLKLKPGEAMFQPPGTLHAYLAGAGVEVMSNSNNVLRGGLTPKHVDVSALLEVVCYRGERAQTLKPVVRGAELIYPLPEAGFSLSRIELSPGQPCPMAGALRLGIVISGKVRIVWRQGELEAERGRAYLLPCACPCSLLAETQAVCYQTQLA